MASGPGPERRLLLRGLLLWLVVPLVALGIAVWAVRASREVGPPAPGLGDSCAAGVWQGVTGTETIRTASHSMTLTGGGGTIFTIRAGGTFTSDRSSEQELSGTYGGNQYREQWRGLLSGRLHFNPSDHQAVVETTAADGMQHLYWVGTEAHVGHPGAPPWTRGYTYECSASSLTLTGRSATGTYQRVSAVP